MTVTTFIGERDNHQFEIRVKSVGPTKPARTRKSGMLRGLYGLHEKLHDLRGGDALQALCLATRLALALLSGFKQDGGQVLFQTGEEVPLDAYVIRIG